MLTSGPGKFLAPTSLGAGYAVAKMLSLRAVDAELAIAQDFFLPVPGWSSTGICAASCGKYDILETLKLNNRFFYIFNCTWSAWSDLQAFAMGGTIK